MIPCAPKAVRIAAEHLERRGYKVVGYETVHRGHPRFTIQCEDGFQFFYPVSTTTFDGASLKEWSGCVRRAERSEREKRERRHA